MQHKLYLSFIFLLAHASLASMMHEGEGVPLRPTAIRTTCNGVHVPSTPYAQLLPADQAHVRRALCRRRAACGVSTGLGIAGCAAVFVSALATGDPTTGFFGLAALIIGAPMVGSFGAVCKRHQIDPITEYIDPAAV